MDIHQWHSQTTHSLQPPSETGQGRGWLREVRRYLRQLRVTTNLGEQITRAMDAIVEDNIDTPPGAKPIIALTAPYGAGKSTLVKEWAQGRYRTALHKADHGDEPSLWQPRHGVSATYVPVIYVTVRAASRIKDINAQILTFLGYPSEGVARATTTRVISSMATHGVRLLVLDDAHMLHTRNHAGRDTLDYLKFLNTELGELNGTMVLVGADLTGSDLLTDQQIEARLHTFTLSPFRAHAVPERRHWQQFLKATESHLLRYLPDARDGLFARTHAGYLWQRTHGYVGETCRLLTHATLSALTASETTVDRRHLDAVRLVDRVNHSTPRA